MKPHAASCSCSERSHLPARWSGRSTTSDGLGLAANLHTLLLTLLPLTNVQSASAIDADEDVVQLDGEWDPAPPVEALKLAARGTSTPVQRPGLASKPHPTARAGLMTGNPPVLPWLALQQWLEDQPDDQRHCLEEWLQSQPAALQHEPSWECCLRVWITAQGKALQTLLQQPLAEASGETMLQAGLTLRRWLN